jgi:hypothetical protein
MEFLEWATGTYIVAGIQLCGFVAVVMYLIAPWVYGDVNEALFDLPRWSLGRRGKEATGYLYWVLLPVGVLACIAGGLAAALSLLTLKPFLLLLIKIIGH